MQRSSRQVPSDLVLVISKVLALFKLRVGMYRGKTTQRTKPPKLYRVWRETAAISSSLLPH